MNEAYGKAGLARNLLRAALAVDGFMLFFALCAAVNNNGGGATLLLLFLAGITGAALWYATKEGLWFVWRLERIWKAVCGHIGFYGEARSYRNGLYGAYVKGETKTIYPQLKNVCGNWQAWAAEVRFFDGQTLDDYNQHAQAFAMAFNVLYANFELADNGLIMVRCGPLPVPESFDYPMQTQRLDDEYGAAVRLRPQLPTLDSGAAARFEPTTLLAAARSINPAAVFAQAEAEARAALQAVPMAVDIAGRLWMMPIEGNHVLVAGRTGAGKGSWVWSLVFGLENACNARLVRLWAIDPKRVELALGRHRFAEYADTIESIVELLEKAVDDMFKRTLEIQGKARKFTPSVETPLNVIVIDELAYVSALITDKKLRDRAEKAIQTILVLGRAVGYSIMACVQDPRKSTVEYRDLFPFKIALGLDGPIVDLVLGQGMHEAGALCEQVPMGPRGAGCGYVISEGTAKPKLVRAAWCSDEAIKGKLGVPPDALLEVPNVDYPAYERDYTPQLGFDGRPLGQFRFRVE